MKFIHGVLFSVAVVLFYGFSYGHFDWIDKDAQGAILTLMSEEVDLNEELLQAIADIENEVRVENVAFYRLEFGDEKHLEVSSELAIDSYPTVVMLARDRDPSILSGFGLSTELLKKVSMDVFSNSNESKSLSRSCVEKKCCRKKK